jgi:hypothetical protein
MAGLVRPQDQGFTPTDAFLSVSPRYGLGLRPNLSERSSGPLAELLGAHELKSLIWASAAPVLARHGPIQVVRALLFTLCKARSTQECIRKQ